MTKVKELEQRIKFLQEELDKRNENTKVWIQSETQARAYAITLERKLKEWEDKYE